MVCVTAGPCVRAGRSPLNCLPWELHAALFINPFWVPTQQDNYKEWLENFSADFDLCWLIGGNYDNSWHTVAGLIMAELISEKKLGFVFIGLKLVYIRREGLFVKCYINKNRVNLTT